MGKQDRILVGRGAPPAGLIGGVIYPSGRAPPGDGHTSGCAGRHHPCVLCKHMYQTTQHSRELGAVPRFALRLVRCR